MAVSLSWLDHFGDANKKAYNHPEIPDSMPCAPLNSWFLCFSPSYRLRLSDGRHVFLDWHRYCGPTFYRDRAMSREVEDWWNDPAICDALAWFHARGCKA